MPCHGGAWERSSSTMFREGWGPRDGVEGFDAGGGLLFDYVSSRVSRQSRSMGTDGSFVRSAMRIRTGDTFVPPHGFLRCEACVYLVVVVGEGWSGSRGGKGERLLSRGDVEEEDV